MKHRYHKTKFGHGQDSEQMLIKKLVGNFLLKGKLVTTIQKAKVTQSVVERLVTKSKEKNEANKNFLLKNTTNSNVVALLFDQIGPALKDKISGVTRIVRLNVRMTDGAQLARLEWVYPVVLSSIKKAPDKTKVAKEETKEKKK